MLRGQKFVKGTRGNHGSGPRLQPRDRHQDTFGRGRGVERRIPVATGGDRVGQGALGGAEEQEGEEELEESSMFSSSSSESSSDGKSRSASI